MPDNRTFFRGRLDEQLEPWLQLVASPLPAGGWIRAIRDALGMTSTAFARRLGVSQPTVYDIEKSERAGSIGIGSLRRAAEALDCVLVYAIIPRVSLEAIVDQRAREIAQAEVDATIHTMALEGQHPGASSIGPLVEATTAAVKQAPRKMWNSP